MAWSPPFAVRRLVLFRGDLHSTDWYRAGLTKPDVAAEPGIEFRWLRAPADGACASQYANQAEMKARLAAGDACLVAYGPQSSWPIYHLWIGEAGAYIPWIYGRVHTRPGELLVYDVWTDKRHRGGTIHLRGAGFACEEALRRSRRHIVAGIERREVAPYRRLYREAGVGDIVPVRAIIALRVPGRTWHWERPLNTGRPQ
jgi:hypothetical protein